METKENYVEMLVLKQNLAIDLVTEDKVNCCYRINDKFVTLAAVPVVKDNKIPMISPSGATANMLIKAIETAEDTNGEKVRSVL
jgi:hypothetical protein